MLSASTGVPEEWAFVVGSMLVIRAGAFITRLLELHIERRRSDQEHERKSRSDER